MSFTGFHVDAIKSKENQSETDMEYFLMSIRSLEIKKQTI
jgi:hypothetical protein